MAIQTFELLILGSSAATPTSNRNPTAQLLNIAERFFLIDCGEGTQMQLRKYKARFQSVNHIFISHLHGDHFLGLPGLIASMHLLGRKNELTVYGPAELEDIIGLIHKHSETQLGYPLKFVQTQHSTKQLIWQDEKVEVYSIPLKHRIKTTGFLFREKPFPRNIDKYKLEKYDVSFAEIHKLKQGFDAVDNSGNIIKNEMLTLDPVKGRSYAFCSDTRYFEELSSDIEDVDLLYHESTFLENKKDRAKQTFHSTAKQAAEIAAKANVKQLLLGHFSARYGNLDEFLDEARPVFPNTELAIEGKMISL
ncbi:MAG: ribonuclease [Bacteroidota bacterium]|jgi:ribonuclease Z|nr:ribonuclease [Bacteroidota bacterium]